MFQRCLPNVACILKCTYYSITFGFLKDGPADLWLLQRQPLPSRCQSLAATSSILLTLGWGPERAISQTSGHCIRRLRRLWILRTLHIFQYIYFTQLGMTEKCGYRYCACSLVVDFFDSLVPNYTSF